MDLLKSGETIKEIARQLGTTERSVHDCRQYTMKIDGIFSLTDSVEIL